MNGSTFVHQGCVYSSDDDFLRMAVPFIDEGLRREEPVLVTTTPVNLGLVQTALGRHARNVDYAESAFFGRRPPQRVAAFTGYRHRHPGAARVRILAEPVWAGRSTRQVEAWECMESALNAVLAGTGIHMVCPYDARALEPEIVGNALRTHPHIVDGTDVAASPGYTEPVAFVRGRAAPLAARPDDAVTVPCTGDLARMRHTVVLETALLGLAGERLMIFAAAVGELLTGVSGTGGRRPSVALWGRPGEGRLRRRPARHRVPRSLHRPASADARPAAGRRHLARPADLRPPRRAVRPGRHHDPAAHPHPARHRRRCRCLTRRSRS
ncbi:MEDS domain-containing protein [Actinomadura mexicana]|uniref:MEDS: MEthanogen/methylotroph, DcmR Sensory domain n=1 Tax=Actinomadura mexicana TaxID=134959 RepID=A0A239HLM9_9ACTN|nr:MEDS domain-containing protein [Actinomadura mexicana]SNS82306.1 MEDS: MEthanogen/methylotroph, DcmR Sensory domain [Actinomadura mexicana]